VRVVIPTIEVEVLDREQLIVSVVVVGEPDGDQPPQHMSHRLCPQ
jgi:hypothetical protein